MAVGMQRAGEDKPGTTAQRYTVQPNTAYPHVVMNIRVKLGV
jgi:hypothetical protein